MAYLNNRFNNRPANEIRSVVYKLREKKNVLRNMIYDYDLWIVMHLVFRNTCFRLVRLSEKDVETDKEFSLTIFCNHVATVNAVSELR